MKQASIKILAVIVMLSVLLSIIPVSVTVFAAEVNTLDGITVADGILSPSFSSEVEAYTVAFVNEIETAQISAVKTDVAATMTINGQNAANNDLITVNNLSPGDNTVSIVVTPTAGAAKTYTVMIKRNPTETQLLDVTNPGPMGNMIVNPGFGEGGKNVDYLVGSNANHLWIKNGWNGGNTESVAATLPNVPVSEGNQEAVGSFHIEKNTPNSPQNWYYGPPSYTATNQVDGVRYQRSGNWAMRFGGRDKWNDYETASNKWSEMSQTVKNVVNGKKYVYSVWMKIEQGAWGRIKISAMNGTTEGEVFLDQTIDDRRETGSATLTVVAANDGYEPDEWYNFKGVITIPAGADGVRFYMPRRQATTVIEDKNSPIYDDFLFAPIGYIYVPPSNLTISNISFSAGQMSPAFSDSVNTYGLSLTHREDTANISVVPAFPDDIETIEVNSMDIGTNGMPYQLNLPTGQTIITIRITGKDKSTKTYTVTAFRETPPPESVDGEFYAIFKENDVTRQKISNVTVTLSAEQAASGVNSLKCVPTKADWNNSFYIPFPSALSLSAVTGYAALSFKIRFNVPLHTQDAALVYLGPESSPDNPAITRVRFAGVANDTQNDRINKALVNAWQTVTIPLTRFNYDLAGTNLRNPAPNWNNIEGLTFYINTANRGTLDGLEFFIDDISIIDIRPQVTLKTAEGGMVSNNGIFPKDETVLKLEFSEAMNASTLDKNHIHLRKNNQDIEDIIFEASDGNKVVTLTLPEQIDMYAQYSLEVISQNPSNLPVGKTINFTGGGTGLGVSNITYEIVSGNLTARIYFSNNTGAEISAQILAAHYSSTNLLKSHKLLNGTNGTGVPAGDSNFSVTLPVGQINTGDKVVVMVWDSWEGMTALRGTYTLLSR